MKESDRLATKEEGGIPAYGQESGPPAVAKGGPVADGIGPSYYRLLVAQFPLGTTDRLGDPVLGVIYTHSPNVWYWEGGPSHMPFPQAGMKLLKEYPATSQDFDMALEAALLQFFKDYPPKAEIRESAGWLSPDGKFYPCHYLEHDSYAEKLAAVHYGTLSTIRIEAEGWAKVWSDGTFHVEKPHELTQDQVNALFDLYTAAKNEKYREGLKKVLGWNGIESPAGIEGVAK